MSLTVALALLGAAVLVAMGAHAVWQARRVGAKRVATAAPGTPAKAEAREPVLGEGGIEPHFGGGGAVDAAAPAVEARAPRRALPRLEPLIHAVAALTVEVQISGDLAAAHLPPSRRAGSKPFFIEGLNAAAHEWEAPAAGQRYSEFQAGVQLANRGGALNEIEYSEFVQKVQGFAD